MVLVHKLVDIVYFTCTEWAHMLVGGLLADARQPNLISEDATYRGERKQRRSL